MDAPPYSGIAALDARALQEMVDEAEALYFEQVLPRYIHRHFRGAGYVFLLEMLAAHDADTICSVLDEGPEPSAGAVKRAQGVREHCPVVVDDEIPITETGGVVLGRFSHSFSMEGTVEQSFRQVTLSPIALLALGLPVEDLAHEIHKTIFHEYIHYFESFLMRSEQPLRGREDQDFEVRRFSRDQARRKDSTKVVKRWIGLGLLVAVVGIIALAFYMSRKVTSEEVQPKPRASAETLAFIASDQARRKQLTALLTQPGATLPSPLPGAAPCSQAVAPPAQLGKRNLGGRGLSKDDYFFEVVIKQLLLSPLDGYDVMPARAEGVGPVRKRFNLDSFIDDQTEPFSRPFRLSFVVTRWRDPVFAPAADAGAGDTGKEDRQKFITGAASGRLLLWSLRKRAFICASGEVIARTPPLTLINETGGRFNMNDDPVLKGRLETLIAAIRADVAGLRELKTAPPPGDK